MYSQEYQEVVAQIENSLDLMEESPSFSVVPTSLVNPDIVLPHKLFLERRGLPEIPPGLISEPREYEMDGARGLIDLDWSQRTPIFHPDDIDRDPKFFQYPFQEGEDLDNDDEEMEVESRPSGGAGDTPMAPPAGTRHYYQHLPATYSFESAQTPGSPRSTHTDTDAAVEMGGLSVAPGGPDQRYVTLRGSAPPATQRTMSTLDLAATVAWGDAAATTEILERFTWPPQLNEADRPLVDRATDATIWEHFQRRLAAATPGTTGQTSAFDWLGHRTLTQQEEDKFVPCPEMTPRKIDRRRQPHKEPEAQCAVSQKRRSQSRPHDEADPKRGRTEGDGKPGKVQANLDWSTTGIQKPISKSDSHAPSSKPGASLKSTVTKVSHKHASASQTRTSPEGKSSRTYDPQLGDPEKREIREKPHRWIDSRVKRLDPAGYMEEINSLRYFRRNAGCYALWIVAITDWGHKFLDSGFKYPIPMFPAFLFTPLPESHQGGAQVPVKPSQVNAPGGDFHLKSKEAWKWLVAVLQFWGEEASSTDGVVYGGRECPISALAEYVLNTINPGLDPGSKVSWDNVVTQTPWMTKRLYGMMAAQETMVKRQALPVRGQSSELEVILERRYSEQILHSKGRGKLVVEKPTAPSQKSDTSTGLTKVRRGDTLKLHLRRTAQGEGWSVEMKDSGPRVGHLSLATPETKPQEGEWVDRPDRSPLTSELLAPNEQLTNVLDYEDVDEYEPSMPDPQITQAVAHIPQPDTFADVEMQELRPPPGFEREVGKVGYDVNLVRLASTEPGSTSPVTARENQMLDGADGATSRTPGAGRLGTNEDSGCTDGN